LEVSPKLLIFDLQLNEMKKSGIYTITCLVNKKVYVGESLNIHKRWSIHRNTLRRNIHHNTHLQNCFNKYGENMLAFSIIEVLDNPTKEILLDRELYWSNFFNSYSTEYGFNINSFQDKYIKNKSEEINIKKVRKIYQISIEDFSIIKLWQGGLSEICGVLNYRRNKLQETCAGKIYSTDKIKRTYKGFIWMYQEDYSPDIDFKSIVTKRINKNSLSLKPPKIKKAIIPYSERNIKRTSVSLQNILTGEIKEFRSQVEAMQFLKITKSSFRNLVKGFKKKGDRVVKITQSKGWKIVIF